jgi:hypothetical protein
LKKTVLHYTKLGLYFCKIFDWIVRYGAANVIAEVRELRELFLEGRFETPGEPRMPRVVRHGPIFVRFISYWEHCLIMPQTILRPMTDGIVSVN